MHDLSVPVVGDSCVAFHRRAGKGQVSLRVHLHHGRDSKLDAAPLIGVPAALMTPTIVCTAPISHKQGRILPSYTGANLRVLNQEVVSRSEDDIQLVTAHVNKGGDNGLTNRFISVI